MAQDLNLALRIKADTEQALRELKGLRGEVTGFGQKSRTAAGDVRKLADSAGAAEQAFGALKNVVAAVGAALVVRQIVDAGLAWQRLERTLRFVTGSSEAARREMEFIESVVDRLGLDLRSTAGEYAKLAAAAKGTALAGEDARRIFVAISEATAVLGLSAEETGGALTAIQQIISKGTVSAEELRGQLGERLVGAFNIAARAIGANTIELNKLLETGQLTADQFLPRFAAELHRTFGEEAVKSADSAQSAINRFHNAVFKLEAQIAGGGFLDSFAASLEHLTTVLNDPQMADGLAAFVGALGKLVEWGAKAASFIGQLGQGLAVFAFRVTHDGELPPPPNQPAQRGRARQTNRRGQTGAPAVEFPALPPLDLSGIGGAGTTGADPIAKAREQLQTLSASLREQIATFGQSDAAALEYRLTLGDLATTVDQLGPAGQQLAEQITEQARALDALRTKQQAAIEAQRERKRLQSEGAQLTESLRTAQEVYNDALAHYQQLLDAGAINQETFNRAVAQAKADLESVKPAVDDAGDALDQFAIAAARSIQGTLADFFNGFKGGLDGLVDAVADTLQKIAAQIAAAQLAKQLFGAGLATGQSSELGGWVGQAATFVAGLFHSGGIVGAGGGQRAISPLAFIGAPHFATGGIFGLGPDEMPAIVHKREEILTPSDPRHRRNGGLSRGGMTVIQNITTPNATSFRQSAAQIARDARLGLDRGRRR